MRTWGLMPNFIPFGWNLVSFAAVFIPKKTAMKETSWNSVIKCQYLGV